MNTVANSKGANTADPSLWFNELFPAIVKTKYQQLDDYPLYLECLQFVPNTDEQDRYSTQSQNLPEPKWRRNYNNLTKDDRKNMLADETFALFLYRTSQNVNKEVYKTVLTFVILFRECLNENGWNKLKESGEISL